MMAVIGVLGEAQCTGCFNEIATTTVGGRLIGNECEITALADHLADIQHVHASLPESPDKEQF
jgi:hypothetical protein